MACYSVAQRLPAIVEGWRLGSFTSIDAAVECATRLALSLLGPGQAPYGRLQIGKRPPASVIDSVRMLGETGPPPQV
jgi:hypothetical protein